MDWQNKGLNSQEIGELLDVDDDNLSPLTVEEESDGEDETIGQEEALYEVREEAGDVLILPFDPARYLCS
jgi:hypothetical protein